MASIYTNGKGIVKRKLTASNIDKAKDKIKWIDLRESTDEELEILTKKFKLHPTTIEDLKAHNSRTKIEDFKHYSSIVLYDVKEWKNDIVAREVDIIVGKKFIITACERDIKELEKLKKDPKRFKELYNGGTDVMLHHILDLIVNRYLPVIEDIDLDVEEAEDASTKVTDKKLLNLIIETRSKILHLKKIAFPIRDKLLALSKGNYKYIREKNLPYFRDLTDDTFKICESIENARDDINAVYDIYMSSISYNANEVMKILSIAATIVLPLTFITGIYGMNFKYMPGLNHPLGFWGCILFMIFMTVAMIAYFKKQKWI